MDPPIVELGSGQTTHSDIELTAATTYRYSVVAYNTFGESSAVVSEAMTDSVPSPPPNTACLDIVLQLQSEKRNRFAIATVTADNCAGNSLSAATVTGRWELPTGVEDPPDEVTNGSGVAVFQSSLVLKKTGGSFTFHVLAVGSFNLSGETSDCINADGTSCNPGAPLPPLPPPGVTMTVQSVDVALQNKGKNYNGQATVRVVEAGSLLGDPVSDATVECSWTFDPGEQNLGTRTGTTNGNGVAVIDSPKKKANSNDSFTCTVTGMTKNGSTWNGVQAAGSAWVP